MPLLRRRWTPVIAAVLATALAGTLTAPAANALPPTLPLPAHVAFSPTAPVAPSSAPVALTGSGGALDATYTYKGAQHSVRKYLSDSATLGFLALHGTKVVDEEYAFGYGKSSLFNSWSVGKSITATALGIAVQDGAIGSIDDPVTRYVPQLRGSAYDGATIRDVLQMSSGNDWSETSDDYFNVTTGATGMFIRMALGTSMTSMARATTRGFAPGSRWNYDTMNTFVLGWIVANATGSPLARYVQARIWRPGGMESTMNLGQDYQGNALAGCCYYATVRDFARFGLLYLNGGKAGGRQVVPASWVTASTHTTVPYLQPGHLIPGKPDDPANTYGYGYQWWLGNGDTGDFLAIGILGQFVYVNPADDVVIVKASQDLSSGATEGEALYAFRALADKIAHQA